LTPRTMRTKLLPCLKTTWREAAIVLRCMGVLVLVLAGGLVFTGHAIAAPDAPVAVGTVGSFTTTSGASGPVGGRFTLEGFSEQDGELVAFGTVTYSLCVPNVDPKNCLATVTQPLEWAVASLAASCAELQLVLGPVDFAAFFTLPGFTIHFDQASLAVSPEPGPAANLLCALAHRLEAGGAAGPLAPMLTQLVRLLGDP
jgi:hypothetical protein